MDPKTVLLIANILSLIGNVVATSAAFLKSKRNILLFQSSNHVLEIVAYLLTEAYSGVTQEVISLVRNVTFVFVKTKRKTPKLIVSIVCLVAGLAVGILFNIYFSGNVLYGYLPVAAAAVYAVFVILAFMLNADDLAAELLMKIGIIFNAVCWSIYGWFIRLYPVMAFNGVAFLLAVISVVRIALTKRKRARSGKSAERESDQENGAGLSS